MTVANPSDKRIFLREIIETFIRKRGDVEFVNKMGQTFTIGVKESKIQEELNDPSDNDPLERRSLLVIGGQQEWDSNKEHLLDCYGNNFSNGWTEIDHGRVTSPLKNQVITLGKGTVFIWYNREIFRIRFIGKWKLEDRICNVKSSVISFRSPNLNRRIL